jgi:anti-sigma regulatory factor (Ser/Thr protein kinase)
MTSEHASGTAIRQRHPTFLSSQLTLAASPEAVPWARRHAVDVLHAWCADDELIQTVELLVSELVTNAVSCGTPPAREEQSGDPASFSRTFRPVGLRLSYSSESTIIEVFDTHPKSPELTFPEADAEHGRGLLLVATLARQWNVYRTTHGKVVWCEVATN